MIFFSSYSVNAKDTESAIRRLVNADIRNIELSSGRKYIFNSTNTLKELKKKYNLNFLVHNYFPFPKVDFVINLASQENELVQNGEQIPETGTPYATVSHTAIHVAFLKSPVAQGMAEPDFKLLSKHTMGEIFLQEQRGVGGLSSAIGGQQPGGVPSQSGTPGAANQELKAINPAQIQGGEEVPQDTQKGSIATKVFGLLGRK